MKISSNLESNSLDFWQLSRSFQWLSMEQLFSLLSTVGTGLVAKHESALVSGWKAMEEGRGEESFSSFSYPSLSPPLSLLPAPDILQNQNDDQTLNSALACQKKRLHCRLGERVKIACREETRHAHEKKKPISSSCP